MRLVLIIGINWGFLELFYMSPSGSGFVTIVPVML